MNNKRFKIQKVFLFSLTLIYFSICNLVSIAQSTQVSRSPIYYPNTIGQTYSLEDMIRLDYGSLYDLDADTEEGIQGSINTTGGKIEVFVYDYAPKNHNAKGIEIYHIQLTSSSPSSLNYEVPLNTHVMILDVTLEYTPNLGFIAAENDIKKRAQDAKVYYSGQCIYDSWTALFKSALVCASRYATPVQPVVIEVRLTGATLFKAKIPGIGIITLENDKVVLSPPGDFFNYCENSTHSNSNLCKLYNDIRNPNIDASEDLFVASHRGWWGYDLGTGPPENTLMAVQQANESNAKIVEMDLTISADNELIFMHDYVMKRLTNYEGSEFSFELPWSTMDDYKVRRRNNVVSDKTLSRFFEVLHYIKNNDMIMMVDVKEQQSNGKDPNCLANCKYQSLEKQKESWTRIVRQCIRQAESIEAKKNMIFKTYYPPEEIYRLVGNQMFSVLWTPMIVPNNFKNNQGQPDTSLMAQFVDKWNADQYNKLIACYETNFFAPNDVILQSFASEGVSYDNLMHYIYATTGRRSGIFSEEPVNPKGTVNRWGKWKIKNPANDIRGDFYRLIGLPYGNIMLITTDRLDIWKEIKQKF